MIYKKLAIVISTTASRSCRKSYLPEENTQEQSIDSESLVT